MLPSLTHSHRGFPWPAILALGALGVAVAALPNLSAVRVVAAAPQPADAELPADERPVPLAEAVSNFNERAAADRIGKDQPPLTEEEVIAALRGIVREQDPDMSDDVYNALQKVVLTRMLPARAQLTFTTGWIPYIDGYYFTVWWADLSIMTGERTGYTYRLRDRKIDSRPLTEAERAKMKEQAARREARRKSEQQHNSPAGEQR